jgi:hypothetical protein
MSPNDTPPRDKRSLADLLGELAFDISALVKTEGRLLRAETAEAASRASAGAASMAAGLVLLIGSVVVLAQALILVLAEWMGPGWAALAVGGALALGGTACIALGRNAFRAARFVPERSMEQARRNLRLVKEQL